MDTIEHQLNNRTIQHIPLLKWLQQGLRFLPVLLCISGPVYSQQVSMTSVTVKPEVLNPVSPLLFGNFLEKASWGEPGPETFVDPETGRLPPDIVAKLKAMNLPLIRFPGGTDIHRTDWRNLIDNVPGRSSPERPARSETYKEYSIGNRFGFEEYFVLEKELGCETMLVVNLIQALSKKKPVEEAALEAAGLVAYCNAPLGAALPEGMPDWPSVRAKNGSPKPHKVKYFQIGNEIWFNHKKMLEALGGEDQVSEDEAAAWVKTCVMAYARAMKAVDPDIILVLDRHMGGKTGSRLMPDPEVQAVIDYLTIHRYSPWAMKEITLEDKEDQVDPGTLRPEDWWNALVAIPGDYDSETGMALALGEKALQDRGDWLLASTEWNWNGWPSGSVRKAIPFSYQLASGIGAAGYIHGMMRLGDILKIANQSMLLGSSWGITAVKGDPEGAHPPVYLPQGHVLMFYNNHHGSERLKVELSGVPVYKQPYRLGNMQVRECVAVLDIMATRKDWTVYVHVINRDFDEDRKLEIDLGGWEHVESNAVHHLLSGVLQPETKYTEVCRISEQALSLAGQPVRVTCPARSVSIFEFEIKPSGKEPVDER